MQKVYYLVTSMLRGRSIRKSLILSLLVVAGILFTSLVATTEKVDAQISFNQVNPPQPILTLSAGVPVAPSGILNLLTSGNGRWFEFQPGSSFASSLCLIYDFKPTVVPGSLQTSRETYAVNLAYECRFSLGPIAIGPGVTSLVNNGGIQIVYPASPNSTERVVIAGSSRLVNNITQQISVWRGESDNIGRAAYRVWHRSSR